MLFTNILALFVLFSLSFRSLRSLFALFSLSSFSCRSFSSLFALFSFSFRSLSSLFALFSLSSFFFRSSLFFRSLFLRGSEDLPGRSLLSGVFVRSWEPLGASWGALGGFRRPPWRKKRNCLRKNKKSGGYVFVFSRTRQTALAFEQKDENGSVLGGFGCSLGRPWEAQEAKRLS